MKNITILLIAILTTSILILTGFQKNNADPMLTYNNDDYDKLWQKVDSLDRLNQPKSALEAVLKIYEVAKEDNNPSQLVKSVIYRGKYESRLEEEGVVNAINKVHTEVEEADFPAKPILQSLLAEMYSQYYDNNAYKIKNRTPGDFNPSDISTWDAERFVLQSITLYNASLQNEESKQVKLSEFTAITTSGTNTSELRPTLYDFLVHRAIDFYRNDRNTLTKPAYQFYIDQEEAFASAKDFVNYKFETEDKTSFKYLALLRLQDVIKFHLNDKNPAALVDADLKRLDFVNAHATLVDKEQRYLKALEDLKKKHSKHEASAEVTYRIAQIHANNGAKYKPSPTDDYKWDLKKAYDMCEEAAQAFPGSYGTQLCKQLQSTLLRKEFEIGTERISLPNEAILGYINYKNVNKAYLRVVKVSEEQQLDFDNLYNDALIKELLKLDPIQTKSFELPNDGDMQQHGIEFKIDKLNKGYYAVLIADNEGFSKDKNAIAYTFIHVSALAYFSQQQKGGYSTFYVTDRANGKPLEGVEAQFYVRRYNSSERRYEYVKKGKIRTDKMGSFRARYNDSYRIKFTKGNDQLFLSDSYYNYGRERGGRGYNRTILFLDRAIYRPGQTVYFKALLLGFDKNGMPSIKKNKKVTIDFFDANFQPIDKKELTSNEYGTVHGSFIAPRGGLTGQMSISSSLDGSRQYFRVEEYKRPKFEVTFEPIKGSYKLEDEVTVTGLAKAYAGNNIDGGKVQYRVVRQVEFPYWRWWAWGWYNPYQRDEVEITNGTTQTDENGKFTITFSALPDKSIPAERKPNFRYKIIADVTDITGETHSNQTGIYAGYVALNANMFIADRVNRDETKSFAINTTNLNGQFEPAQGSIKIYKLKTPNKVYKSRYWERPDREIMTKEEFEDDFPQFAFKNEDQYQHWDKAFAVYEGEFDTDKSKELDISKNIKNWNPGKYFVEFKTQDKFGAAIEQQYYFTLFDDDSKKVPLNNLKWFANDTKTYQPGETAKFSLGSAIKKINVLFQVEQDQKIVESRWETVKGIEEFKIPIKEEHRGNIHYHLTYVTQNRVFTASNTIAVPWTNKELKFEYATFRNKLLPGQEEEWQIKISGDKKDKVAAEMLATMYDASLDAFAPNSWAASLYPMSYMNRQVSTNDNFRSAGFQLLADDWQPRYYSNVSRNYPQLNLFGFRFYDYNNRPNYYSGEVLYNVVTTEAMPRSQPKSRNKMAKTEAAEPTVLMDSAELEELDDTYSPPPPPEPEAVQSTVDGDEKKENDFSDVKVRTNLNETVFFMPNLMTDAEGNVIIKFTMNEALTRWKFMGMAHTQELELGFTTNTVVTQKDLMVMPNPPRFFRENDEIYFTAKVSNLSEEDLEGTAQLQLFDAITMKPIDGLLENSNNSRNFKVGKGLSSPLSWRLKIPDSGVSAVTYRVVAKAGDFSDGEESALPVLTNRMMVVETQPLAVRGEQTKSYTFKAMQKASQSKTLKNHEYTLEFTSNPAWYAVQSLPYLMEYPYECTEQIFNRFYANSLATSVANSHPKIKQVFDTWKNIQPEALKSNLTKNEDLKYALLEETPWVLAAQSEEKQKQNIGLLFDLNRMSNELDQTLKKLQDRQLSNGGFAWFPGGRDSWYITQYLVEGMGHLDRLGVNAKNTGMSSIEGMSPVLAKAVGYIDARIVEDYRELEKRVKEGKAKFEDDHLGYMQIHYLYARSFFLSQSMNEETTKVFNYYLGQADKYWMNKSQYMQGMLALSLHRSDKVETPKLIVKSLDENSLNSDELGMYWKYNTGYYWYQLPIETHALMIEVFDEVAQDEEAVADLKLWMLKNKQTNHWKTTKATSAAVYALLLRGDNWLLEDQEVTISLGGKTVDQSTIKKEAGTGYFKIQYGGDNITPDMANIKVENPNKSPAWGAVYWQYFEDLDNIKHFKDTPLKINKVLSKEVPSPTGPRLEVIKDNSKLTPGDKIIVRIELTVDRTMEYVHMKDMRAAGFEPINVLSQYKYQGGLGYYESTRDAATNFFFSYLPKGSYVFEYPLRVNHKGDFSNGITTIQCMYAPEFTAHSEGVRVTVE